MDTPVRWYVLVRIDASRAYDRAEVIAHVASALGDHANTAFDVISVSAGRQHEVIDETIAEDVAVQP